MGLRVLGFGAQVSGFGVDGFGVEGLEGLGLRANPKAQPQTLRLVPWALGMVPSPLVMQSVYYKGYKKGPRLRVQTFGRWINPRGGSWVRKTPIIRLRITLNPKPETLSPKP